MTRPAHELPAPTTTFVGRDADLRAIDGWFARGHRLVVIVGPPGMGKTRVAIELARRVTDAAVRFCDLTEVRDVDGMCAQIAACLELSLEAGADVAACIGLALREGGELLVLDNFEHLVDVGAATLGRWLKGAAAARLLVTSRERLRIDGEVVHELEPLSLVSDAMELFVDRARLQRRDFAPSADDAPLVAEIVRRLDGIPLAIEAAAACMDVLAPRTLLDRMRRHLDLLAGGRRDASARHATLRGAIDGSWAALPNFARAALAQASVFRGGFTLAAAEAVIDLSELPAAPAIVDVLAILRQKSLLRLHGGRFSLYDSIRAYAAEKLAPASEAATRARHTRYFVERFTGTRRARASDLVAERDNLIVALEGALAAPPTPERIRIAAQILLALDPALPTSGPSDAHIGWLDAVLAQPADRVDSEVRAKVLLARGRAVLARGRMADSLPTFFDVLAIARSLADRSLEARALIGIGLSYQRQREDSSARPHFEAALELLSGKDLRRESVVHRYLGRIEQEAANPQAARAHYLAALHAAEIMEPRERGFAESKVRMRLAFLALDEGDPGEAQLECEQAIALALGVGSRGLQGLGEGCLAIGRWLVGRLDEADALIGRAVRLLVEARDQSNLAYTQAVRGAILAAQDRVDESVAVFAAADAASREIGDHVGLAVSSIYQGHLDLARGRLAAAAGDTPRALAHRAAAERRWGRIQPTAYATTARVARRVLQRALDDIKVEVPRPTSADTLVIDRDRRWIRIPGRVRWVRFGRQAVLWRLLLELSATRQKAPGQPIAANDLIAAGWPGQTVIPTAAQNRLHVAVNALRKLGLRDLIVTRDEGYLLTPSVSLRWVA